MVRDHIGYGRALHSLCSGLRSGGVLEFTHFLSVEMRRTRMDKG